MFLIPCILSFFAIFIVRQVKFSTNKYAIKMNDGCPSIINLFCHHVKQFTKIYAKYTPFSQENANQLIICLKHVRAHVYSRANTYISNLHGSNSRRVVFEKFENFSNNISRIVYTCLNG